MTTTAELLKTPLYDWHVAHGGRMVEFGGWSMPVQYASILEEHNATRNAVGAFDISHMGRFLIIGEGNVPFIDSLATRRVADLGCNQVRYSLLCNEEGGILDDVLIYGSPPEEPILIPLEMVVNAGNRQKILAWLQSYAKEWQKVQAQHDFTIVDVTLETAMVAVQGPKAFDVLNPFFQADDPTLSIVLRSLKYYHLSGAKFDGCPVTVSRTGYTGEDGFEIFFPAERAVEFWQRIVTAAEAVGGMATGLGARDTLRLEAAMPLYGHELSEAINPYQAGLSFAVNLKNREFVGRAALEKFAADKSQPVRVGLQLDGKRVPRQGCAVLQNDEIVGEVTSGTFSPTFERPIAMAYVRPSAQAVGKRLAVDIRGTQHSAVVVPLPFYTREKKT